MRKYIKFFDEEEHHIRRVRLIGGLVVEVRLHKEYCRVRFVHEPTGLCPIHIDLYLQDKKLEKFCDDLIACRLNDIVEGHVRDVVEEDYHAFQTDDRKSWPLDKFAKAWLSDLKLMLECCYNKRGKSIAKLAPVARQIYGE